MSRSRSNRSTGCTSTSIGRFFGIITRRAIRRGTFTSGPDLIGAIRAVIDAYNTRCEPFRWTRDRRPDHRKDRAVKQFRPNTRYRGGPGSGRGPK
jgi:hypothetical protein